MPRVPAVSLPLLTLICTACGAGESPDSTVIVRDSAGLRIVESARPAWPEGSGWRISLEPTVQIGVQDGPVEYQLHRVVAATRLGDGRIVVANRGTNEIRYYDAAGRHLHTVGGAGDGPGEFRALSGITALPGDSILAWDVAHNRLSVFSPRGEFVGTTPIEPISSDTPTRDRPFTAPSPVVLAAFADGSLLAQPVEIFPNLDDGMRRDSVALVRYRRDGTIAERLGRFPGREYVSDRRGEPPIWELRVFGRLSHFAALGRELLVGTNDRFEVRVLGGEGEQVFRRPHEPRPVTREDIEAYRERRLANARDEAARAYDRRVADVMSYPSEMPPYRNLVADGEGNVWVEHYRAAPDEQPRWSVFAADGRWLGEVATPVGLQVYEIGADYVLGRWRDGLGVEYVRLYALVKDAG